MRREWPDRCETSNMTVISIFSHCVQAIRNNVLIERVSATDKEFHFQNRQQNLWVKNGQLNGGARVDFLRDGRTNKWCEAKIALAA
jgi:hypothetical protein